MECALKTLHFIDDQRDFVGVANIYTGAMYIAPGMTLNRDLNVESPMKCYVYMVGNRTLPTELSILRNQPVGTVNRTGVFYNKAGHQQLLDILCSGPQDFIGFYGTINRRTKTIRFGYNSNVCNPRHFAGSRTATVEYQKLINDGFEKAGWGIDYSRP